MSRQEMTVNDKHPIRIAWIGGASAGGGVGGYGRDLLRGLLRVGQHITLFTGEDPAGQHALLDADAVHGKLDIVHEPLHWHWDRWYSRTHKAIFLSSLIARTRLHGRLVRRLVESHRLCPFDVIVQFSQFELLTLRKHLKRLPPVVLLPCVHAAGELKWHRTESSIARQSERLIIHWGVRANLIQRSIIQRRDASRVAAIFGMSKRFNELINRDYGVPPDRQAVIYQPAVDLDSGPGPLARQRESKDPVRIVFVGRIAVRKGIDRVVELSRRLHDCAGQVTLEVVGGPSFWSNYSGELKKLDPAIGSYVGVLPHEKIMELFSHSDILIMPSRYEPGGIVLAEAAAQGCLPVASDEIGSAEQLNAAACEKFDANDMNAFETSVRIAIRRVREDGLTLRREVSNAARSAFAIETQAGELLAALRKVICRQGDHSSPSTSFGRPGLSDNAHGLT